MADKPVPDFRKIFELLPGLYLVLTPDLRIVAATEAYLQATLTRRSEIIGKHLFEVFPDSPDDPRADSIRNTRASMNRVLQTLEPDVMVIQRHDVRRPESEGGGFVERYWSPVNSPLLNPDGSLAYIIHRVENVTDFIKAKQQGVEQAKLTESLREWAVQMEAEIYSRTREVADSTVKLKEAHEELARLYEKTRELDELKSRFFANVSHELRTPLTLILGPLRELLQAADLAEQHRHDVGVAERNARMLLKHVNDLLDLSRLDAGGVSLDYTNADLVRLARYVASHFENLARDKGIGFYLDAPETLPVQIDAPKVQRVLFNLLSNALKFTNEGGVVRVTVARNDDHAIVAVEDNGPGIPAEMREAVFERFRQVDGSPTRRHGGTGLGLAIVKEFVGLHAGAVVITEPPGGGARFEVTLPLAAPDGVVVRAMADQFDGQTAQDAIAELAPAGEGASAVSTLPSDAPLVLVVEDNREMNAYVAKVLGGRYRVATAFDGHEGLEKALRLHPDLIVSDLMMPRLDGEEMVAEVRRRREMNNVPILLLTAKADENLRIHLLRSGAQDCLVKPFAAEELVARATGLVERKRQAEASLRVSEERFRIAQELSPDGFVIFQPVRDPEGKVVDFIFAFQNAAAARMSGTDQEAVVGKRLLEVFPAHRGTVFLEAYRHVAETGESRVVEASYEGDFATDKAWFRVAVVPIGEDIAVLVEDITERKNFEERLKQTVEKLERSNRELQQFAYVSSHDLQEPLRTLAVYVQLLQKRYQGQLDERADRYIGYVHEAATRMSTLITDLLAFTHVDADSGSFGRVSMDAALGKALANLKRLMGEAKAVVESEQLPEVEGSETELTQLFQNLLENAIKFRKTEISPRVKVSAEQQGAEWIFAVCDNGIGIEPQYYDRIFLIFQRLQRREDFPGTGIGLAICRKIVEHHHGRIWVESTPGHGSSFYFTLPVRKE